VRSRGQRPARPVARPDPLAVEQDEKARALTSPHSSKIVADSRRETLQPKPPGDRAVCGDKGPGSCRRPAGSAVDSTP
jgi:hypothetical protein